MDWHVLEPLSLVEYSKPPMYPGSYSSPGDLLTTNEFVRTNLTPKMVGVFERMFPLMLRFFDAKPCPSSMGTQNSFGLADGRKTTQDDLPITSRTNSNWCRTREKLEGARENTSAVGYVLIYPLDAADVGRFYMDGALSFIPMTFRKPLDLVENTIAIAQADVPPGHRPLTSAAACSSLDFSLRFFAPVDLSQWHLLEHHTEAAGNARTFSVGRLWDERGKEIAQMSQSSILRPRPGEGIAAKL